MKKTILTIAIVLLWISNLSAQKSHISEEKVLKEIHQVLSNFNYKKDSLIIFAINFTLTMEKKGGKIFAKKIIANDNLAYQLFPNYKKFANIDFSSVLGTNTHTEVVIPILIYGASPDKMIYKDQNGKALINFNAAVNAALALTSNRTFNNLNSSDESFGSGNSAQPAKLFKSRIIVEPYIIYIANIP